MATEDKVTELFFIADEFWPKGDCPWQADAAA